jgi:hypothetical protein
VAFSPDGARLASGSNDKTIKLWDARTGQHLFDLKGHTGGVASVAFSPDGARLASASGDYTVKTWDPATGQELRTLRGHSQEVSTVVFSPDGARLLSGSRDRTVKLWDAASGQELRTLKGHSADVTSVAFSPNGEIIASACDDHSIRLWDAKPLSPALRVELEARSLVVFHFASLKPVLNAERETHSLFGLVLPQPSPKAQLLGRLRYAPARSELVREKALELAEEYWSLRDRLRAMDGVGHTFEQNLIRRPMK